MKTAIACALLVALPVELFILGAFPYPVGHRLDPHAPLFHRAMEHLWLALHAPGLLVWQWLTRHGNPGGLELLAVFLSGYLELAAVFAGLIVLGRRLEVRMGGKPQPPH
jgi:hypothetical protein